MKMCITENNTNSKFNTKKYFSRKMIIFPDIQPKFPDKIPNQKSANSFHKLSKK